MDKNQELREKLKEYLIESGVTQLHICKKTEIKTDILSRWKNDVIPELFEKDLEALEQYLNEH